VFLDFVSNVGAVVVAALILFARLPTVKDQYDDVFGRRHSLSLKCKSTRGSFTFFTNQEKKNPTDPFISFDRWKFHLPFKFETFGRKNLIDLWHLPWKQNRNRWH
jgi:hypothetical protein